jgi:hypothetical protein
MSELQDGRIEGPQDGRMVFLNPVPAMRASLRFAILQPAILPFRNPAIHDA